MQHPSSGNDDPYDPYAPRVLSYNELQTDDFFTLSARGVVRLVENETQFWDLRRGKHDVAAFYKPKTSNCSGSLSRGRHTGDDAWSVILLSDGQ